MPPHSDGSPQEGLSTPKPYVSSREEVVRALAESGSGNYEAIGGLGRDRLGRVVHLARELASGRLVAIRTQSTEPARHTGDQAAIEIEVLHELDASVPTLGSACHRCGAPLAGWDRACANCGTDLVGIVPGSPPEMSRDELAQAVRGAVAGTHDVIGAMDRVDRGGVVYFAREAASGRLTVLWPFKDSAGYALAISKPVTMATPGGGRPAVSGGPPDVPPGRGPRESTRLFGGLERAERAERTPPSWENAAGSPGASAPPTSEVQRVCPVCGSTYEPTLKFCPLDGSPLRAPTTTDLVGHLIAGRYSVLRKLGEGGMGQVYLAEHVKMGRQCAIKVIRPGLVNDVQAINRFAREAANASRITHPNITTVYDYGETDGGVVYLAMEFVDGPTLSAVLAQEGALPPPRALEIARQVAEALSAAHDLGIVHRDLKPDNIMLARARDARECVKVVDFGIAKATQGAPQQLTQTGVVIGTPEYMSPEQLVGDSVDGRSDIYSLGCILFKMLVGESAFAGPSGEVSVNRRLTEAPPRPRKFKPALPKALDELTVKALARRPEDRFQTAAEFRDALQAAVSGASGGRFQLPAFQWRRGTTPPPRSVVTPPATPQASPPPLASPPPGAVRSVGGGPVDTQSGRVRGPDERVERRTPTPREAPSAAGTPTPTPTPAFPERQTPRPPDPLTAAPALPELVVGASSGTATTATGTSDPATPATPSESWKVHVPVRQPSQAPRTGGRRLALGVAAVVVAGALAVVGMRALRDERAGARPTAETADSLPVAVTPPPTPDSASVRADSSPDRPGPRRAATTEPPRADNSRRARDTSARPSMSDSSRAPAVTSARATTGTLRIGSELPPGATVTIDGEEVQLGPRRAVELPLGEHHVVVSAPGHQPAALTITIEPGSPQRWDPVLRPAPAAPDVAESPADSATPPPAEQEAGPEALPPEPSVTPFVPDSARTDAPAGYDTSTPPGTPGAAAAPQTSDAVSDAAAAIQEVVADYGRAIGVRSVPQLRRLYPGMPNERQAAWRSFFADARDVLDVELELTASDVAASGAAAAAVLNGTITFEDAQSAVHTVRYDARGRLRRQAGRWRFVDLVETRTAEP